MNKIKETPSTDKQSISLMFPYKWENPMDHIDFVYGIDPASGESQAGAVMIIRTEKKVKWQKGDLLYGPNGIKFKVVDVGFWTWLYRILTLSKYYNAKITLIAEQ